MEVSLRLQVIFRISSARRIDWQILASYGKITPQIARLG
jgi:hypothetical protein